MSPPTFTRDFLPSQFLLHRVHHAVDQQKKYEAAESLEEEKTLGFDTIPWSDLRRTFWRSNVRVSRHPIGGG